MKVSVIIPCYNASVFLEDTIKSVQKQTYKNLEIIIVNDCSTDNSLAIMNKMAQNDSRIVIVDKKINEGVDYARRSGVEIATGDFLTFLDADDWLAPNAVLTWVDIATCHHVDIVYANMKRVFSKKFKILRTNKLDKHYAERIVVGPEKENLFISFFGVNIIPVNLCGNLFKKQLFIPSLKWSRLKFGEDLAIGLQLYNNATSFYMTEKVVYYYRWGGVTAKYQPEFINSVKQLFERKMEYIIQLGLVKERQAAIIELANCLATHVSQLAVYFPKKTEQNLQALEREFSESAYDYFTEVQSLDYFKDGALNTACVNRDYRRAYAIACANASSPRNRIRHIIKRASSSILRHIRL